MPKLPGIRITRESGHIIMSNGKIRLVIPCHDTANAIIMGGDRKANGIRPVGDIG